MEMMYRKRRPVAAVAMEVEATSHSHIAIAGSRVDYSMASLSVHGLGPEIWTGDPASRLCGVWWTDRLEMSSSCV